MTYPFPPGKLWDRTCQAFEKALEIGSLQPIPTSYEWIESNGVPFLVRVIDNLWRKEKSKAKQSEGSKSRDFNPFLPYDPDLFVSDLTPRHLVLLNKFNVMDHHLLIVTRAFEEQTSWLTHADFEALSLVMAEMDGLSFYNGGRLAGASQRHKHLQLVPLPFCDHGPPIPFAPCLEPLIPTHEGVGRSPQLTFTHQVIRFDGDEDIQGDRLYTHYLRLMESIHMGSPEIASQPQGAYNLLVTRQWMMAVPRSQEDYQGIPINSLGFAGALLAKNQSQLEQIKQIGPLNLLNQVALPQDEPNGAPTP